MLLRSCLLALLTIPALFAAPADPLPGIDDRWLRVRSANFEVYSHAGEEDARQLVHDLELLRAVLVQQFKITERARLEVTVFLFRDQNEFREYLPNSFDRRDIAGIYLAGPERAHICVPAGRRDAAHLTIFHEYVHHLFHSTEEDPPLWYNEGTAELLSTIELHFGKVEIGRPSDGRVAELRESRLLPLETLFAADHDSNTYRSHENAGVFYAESWALLHYLCYGENHLPPAGVSRFLRLASSAGDAGRVNFREQFKACLGIDYPEMQRRLDAYVRDGAYRFGKFPAPDISPAIKCPQQSVRRDEIQLRLAELALRTHESGAAKLLLLGAAEKADADPRIFEVLGAAALTGGDSLRAAELWEKAVAAGTNNVAIHRLLPALECEQRFAEFDLENRLPTPMTTRLRERLQRTIAAEPAQSGAYEMLAWVEAYAAEPDIANVNIVQRQFSRLHHQDRMLLALALVRVHLGKPAEARELLGQLSTLDADSWTAHGAKQLLSELGTQNSAAP